MGPRGPAERLPVWHLLGAKTAPEVEVNATITAADRAGAATEAAAAREAGFRAIKLKAAVGDDAGRIAAVRAVAGPDMQIRLDANGAWSVPEAQAALRALAPAGVELCEEPVHGLEQMQELNATTDVPLAIDETTQEPGALDRRVCDAVCLKIARGGGISGVIEQARRARAAGYEVYLASTLDGPLGIAAALHAAAAIKPDRAVRPGDARRVRRPHRPAARRQPAGSPLPPARASATACSTGTASSAADGCEQRGRR